MTAFSDANARLIGKGRAGIVQRFSAFCQIDQHVQLRQRAGALLQVAQVRHQHVEQLFIQLFFQGQRLAFRGEDFVFVLFQFRNDIAFGVFQRLATHVVNRRQVALPAANLNVVTVYRVIPHFQGVEPKTLALADFQLIEVIRRTVGQRAPFVQLFVVAWGNHAAITHQNRRRIDNGALQQFAKLGKFAHGFAEFLYRRAVNVTQLRAQFRQLLECMTHPREVAWSRCSQCQARKDTLQIAHLAQNRLQFGIAILQRGNRLLTANQRLGIADRHMQPAFQHAAAHWRNRTVEDRRERIFYATRQVLRDLQITARGSIHDDAVLLALHGDRADMRQGGALGIFHVLQETTGRTQPARCVFNAKANQIAGAKLQIQLLARGINFEFPQRTTAQPATTFNQRHFGEIFGIEQFCRVGALQFGGHRFTVSRFTQAKTSGANIQRRVAKAFTVLPQRCQQVILALL